MPKIKITPEQLMAQSTELASLQAEFESLFTQVTNSLNGLNESWSANLASNFSGKITAAQKSFASVGNMLTNGAAAAKMSSSTFAEPGKILSLLCGEHGGVSDKLSSLTSWLQEHPDAFGGKDGAWIEALSETSGLDGEAIRDVMEKMQSGDYEGALTIAADKGVDLVSKMLSMNHLEGTWVDELNDATGGTLGLATLEQKFYEHWIGDPMHNAVNIVKDRMSGNPDYEAELNELGQFAFNFGPGAVIKSTADTAFDVVKNIPGIGDYYAEKGVTDGEGAIGSMIGDITLMVTGDNEAAAADANYYKEHGGLAKGFVDGVADIGSYVSEQMGHLWHSMMSK